MAASRATYILMASEISYDVKNIEPNEVEGFKKAIDSVCVGLRRDNNNFDKSRFLAACGLGD